MKDDILESQNTQTNRYCHWLGCWVLELVAESLTQEWPNGFSNRCWIPDRLTYIDRFNHKRQHSQEETSLPVLELQTLLHCHLLFSSDLLQLPEVRDPWHLPFAHFWLKTLLSASPSVGLRAPNRSKLILAIWRMCFRSILKQYADVRLITLRCLVAYGKSDSFRLPTTCLVISRAAKSWNRNSPIWPNTLKVDSVFEIYF